MTIVSSLRRTYHLLVPLALRRRLRLARWSAERRARERLWHATNGCIAAGPFAGERLLGTDAGDCQGPVLLGAYENETHDWLEREVARGWRCVVNVGSHVGVYSTGLAMRLRDATVYAFEMDDALRAQTRRSADLNGVTARVQTFGCATPALLASLPLPPGEGALVVCDCEGAERELMDPASVPWLARSALCVELHDFAAPGATDVLTTRFALTHDVVIVQQAARDAAVWASRAGIAVADAELLMNEGRRWGNVELPGRWLLASPRY